MNGVRPFERDTVLNGVQGTWADGRLIGILQIGYKRVGIANVP